MVVWKNYSSPTSHRLYICQWDGSWWLLYILAVGLSRNGGFSPSRLPCSWKTWWSAIVRISNFQTNPCIFAWLGNIINHSDSFSQYGGPGSLVFYNRNSGFLVLKQLHMMFLSRLTPMAYVVLEISLVTPMRLVRPQISTSHADFVMAGKARLILHAITAVWYWKHDERLYICSRKSNRIWTFKLSDSSCDSARSGSSISCTGFDILE